MVMGNPPLHKRVKIKQHVIKFKDIQSAKQAHGVLKQSGFSHVDPANAGTHWEIGFGLGGGNKANKALDILTKKGFKGLKVVEEMENMLEKDFPKPPYKKGDWKQVKETPAGYLFVHKKTGKKMTVPKESLEEAGQDLGHTKDPGSIKASGADTKAIMKYSDAIMRRKPQNSAELQKMLRDVPPKFVNPVKGTVMQAIVKRDGALKLEDFIDTVVELDLFEMCKPGHDSEEKKTVKKKSTFKQECKACGKEILPGNFFYEIAFHREYGVICPNCEAAGKDFVLESLGEILSIIEAIKGPRCTICKENVPAGSGKTYKSGSKVATLCSKCAGNPKAQAFVKAGGYKSVKEGLHPGMKGMLKGKQITVTKADGNEIQITDEKGKKKFVNRETLSGVKWMKEAAAQCPKGHPMDMDKTKSRTSKDGKMEMYCPKCKDWHAISGTKKWKREMLEGEEFVRVTGGPWKGKTGVVKKWVPGLHYQDVHAGGEKRQISLQWIKRTEKGVKEDVLTEAKESNLEIARRIVKEKQAEKITTKDGKKMLLDSWSAQALVTVYDNLKKPALQAKFERMMNGTSGQVRKLVDFVFSMAGKK